MVGFKHKSWLPEIASCKRDHHHAHRHCSDESKKKGPRLRILAFETAKTMSRLISFYKSLSDDEISRLKNKIIKSKGVAYLTSTDEEFLLSLACAERIEDLDRAVAVVSRLGKKCTDPWLNQFDLVYADLKLGVIAFGKLEYGSRYSEKRVHKMEKLVSATASLHAALGSLSELEAMERKMKLRKNKQTGIDSNLNYFNQKLENQRKEVRIFKETSLWRKSFDKCVSIMATIVIIIHIRICSVFKPYVSNPPISLLHIARFQQERDFHLIEQIKQQMENPDPKKLRLYCRESEPCSNEWCDFGTEKEKVVINNSSVFHAAGASTLGGSGLALHYANVILLVQKYLDSAEAIERDEREALYQMLPENLKALVRTKLNKNMKRDEDDAFLAEGWRAAMIEIMAWLAPLANDTLKWQIERNVDKMKFDSKPSVLLLQTLHFSDKEKTEAAIAEVLVALSCVYRYENRNVD